MVTHSRLLISDLTKRVLSLIVKLFSNGRLWRRLFLKIMFDLKNLKKAVEQISEEKGVDPAKVLDAIESSIAAAYKKEYMQKGEYVRCRFDLKTGDLKFWQVKGLLVQKTL